jgi:predicted nucleic acid-binding protein
MKYVLDTNIIVNAGRSLEFQAYLHQEFDLFSPSYIRIISIVSAAELLVIAPKGNLGERRIARQGRMLQMTVEVPLTQRTKLLYAELDLFGRGKHPTKPLVGTHRIMGKNDLWIAATAIEHGAELITTDKDFSHLDGHFLKVHYIDADKVLNR